MIKGDISNIKNWRGISLNYTGYKLYSSAITARLKKVIDKCIYVEQKGYSKTKVISEVVLNIKMQLNCFRFYSPSSS